MENKKTPEEIIAEVEAEFAAEVEQSTEEPAVEQAEEEQITEEGEESPEEEAEEVSESTDEGSEETTEDQEVVSEDLHKRNEAFKQMRLQNEKLSESDKFVTELATQYGISKEDLMVRFRDDMSAKQAEKEGLSKEQYNDMQEMKNKLASIEERSQREMFNLKADNFAKQNNLKQDEMMEVFTKAQEYGLNVLDNPDLLDVVYRSMNYDNAIQKGRQAQLEESKRRSKSSTGRAQTGGAPELSEDAKHDAEIKEILKELNL